ncbi:MAG: HEAT repeat domain-containing protein [Candidatus Omnitrophica bacterium]|nr:HEAT repeat domain-containing protein [Candidatus Omnitrophota bacterium]
MEKDYQMAEPGRAPTRGAHDSKINFDQKVLQIYRDTLIPAIKQEVNAGQNFAKLRQIYAAMILAAWYKTRLKNSVLGKGYADQNKTTGVGFTDGVGKEAIYEKYLQSARDGVFKFIKDEEDVTGDIMSRQYFSGGITGPVRLTVAGSPAVTPIAGYEIMETVRLLLTGTAANPAEVDQAVNAHHSMISPTDRFTSDFKHQLPGDDAPPHIATRLTKSPNQLKMQLNQTLRYFARTHSPAYSESLAEMAYLAYEMSTRNEPGADLLFAEFEAAFESLVAGLNDQRITVRRNTVIIFGFCQENRASEHLISYIQSRHLPEELMAGAWALGMIGSETAIPALRQLTQHDSIQVREVANYAIEYIEGIYDQDFYSKNVFENYLSAASSPAGVGEINENNVSASPAKIDQWIAQLADQDLNKREMAAYFLGRENDLPQGYFGRIVSALTPLLHDDYFPVREQVAFALGQMGAITAIQPLQDRLEPEYSEGVRANIIGALENIGGPRAIAALQAITPLNIQERRRIEQAIQNLNQSPKSASPVNQLGGINLDPRQLDLQVTVDGNGVSSPIEGKTWDTIQFQGVIPVLYAPVPVSLPQLMGMQEPKKQTGTPSTDMSQADFPAGKELDA